MSTEPSAAWHDAVTALRARRNRGHWRRAGRCTALNAGGGNSKQNKGIAPDSGHAEPSLARRNSEERQRNRKEPQLPQHYLGARETKAIPEFGRRKKTPDAFCEIIHSRPWRARVAGGSAVPAAAANEHSKSFPLGCRPLAGRPAASIVPLMACSQKDKRATYVHLFRHCVHLQKRFPRG